MVVIYIRHGDDEYDDPTKAHDHRLTNGGYEDALKVCKGLVKMYGIPDKIHTSPFKRAVQTVQAFTKCIKKLGSMPEIIYDSDMSRYFSSKERREPQVYPQTEDYGVPIHEGWDAFKDRCKDHRRKFDKHGHYSNDRIVIWCITHALVLKQIAEYFDVVLPEHIPFLHDFRIRRVDKGKGKHKDSSKHRSIKTKSDKGKTKSHHRDHRDHRGPPTCLPGSSPAVHPVAAGGRPPHPVHPVHPGPPPKVKSTVKSTVKPPVKPTIVIQKKMPQPAHLPVLPGVFYDQVFNIHVKDAEKTQKLDISSTRFEGGGPSSKQVHSPSCPHCRV